MRRNSPEIHPLAGAIGAEIAGVDLAGEIDDDTIAAIRRAWLDHLVIFFRGQDLQPARFLAFAQRFGKPIEYPFVRGIDGFPLITPVVKLAHERVNFGGLWHSDTAYLETPPMGTMLIAREVPPYGGDTLFANMYLAYEALSAGMRRLLDSLITANSSAKADVTKTREEPHARACPRRCRHRIRGGAPGRAHPSRDRPQGALRQWRSHRAVRGHDPRGKRPTALLSIRASDPARIHLPLSLGKGLARVLGQSLRPAQPDQRLSRLPPRHAPDNPRRRPPALTWRHRATATPCTSTSISGRARPETVIKALAGKLSAKISRRSWVKRSPSRASVMNTVLSALPVRSANTLRKLSLSMVLRHPRLCYKGPLSNALQACPSDEAPWLFHPAVRPAHPLRCSAASDRLNAGDPKGRRRRTRQDHPGDDRDTMQPPLPRPRRSEDPPGHRLGLS